MFGIIMVYPLLWLLASSFKPNNEIFASMSLIPSKIVAESYVKGWKGSGEYAFSTFFINTMKVIVPSTAAIFVSTTLVAYGFARFKFPLKKPLFILMLSTLMLPGSVIVIPRYILFRDLGWLDSYMPFIIPALFAGSPFFIFMLVQFLRGIPKELDESAVMDGCGSFAILVRILIPLCKPALIAIAIFHFIWTWNDFFDVLIYISSVSKFTIALGLRMSIDSQAGDTSWNRIMAMSVVSMLPCILVFFFAQKYFVEGIVTTGIKG